MKLASNRSNRLKKQSFRYGTSIAALLILCGGVARAESDEAGIETSGTVSTGAATTATTQAVIEERNRYALRLMTQIYDGVRDLSHTQMLGFGRVRKGNRSLTQFDFGDGAIVIDGPSGLAASRFINVSPTEKGVVYNYDSQTIAGDSEIANFHNRYVRKWLGRGPDLGADAKWIVRIPLSDFGVPDVSGKMVEIRLNRKYFTHAGKPMVLVHYEIPSFGYNAQERMAVQWGRGISLTDPGFSKIYLNSMLHRGVINGGDAVGHPFRYARTMVAANPDGSAMVDYRTVPELQDYVPEFFSAQAMRVIPTGQVPNKPFEQSTNLARNMDVLALSIGEDGANDVPTTASAHQHGADLSTPGTLIATTANYFSKFSAAAKGITSYDEYVQFLSNGLGADLARYTKALESVAKTNELGYINLRADIVSLDKRSKGLTLLLQKEIDKIDAIDDLNEAKVDKLLGLLDNLDRQKDAVRAEMKALDNQALVIARVKAQIQSQIPALTKKLEQLKSVGSNPKIVKFAEKFSDLTDTLEGPLGFLDGALTVAEVYSNAASLGTFDPSDKDLNLAGNYDSAAGFVSDISLNILGILGNAAQGNVVATVSDTLAFSSGRFTDLYKVIAAADHARSQSRQAHMDYILTLKKQTAQLAGIEAEKLEELRNTDSGLYTSQPTTDGGVSDANWQDPRLDPNTGLPKPSYWAFLKTTASGRSLLVKYGIDPDAPVGGWPGGIGPEFRPTENAARPNQPPIFDINDGENYPTAEPRDTSRVNNQQSDSDDYTGPPPSILSDAQLANIEREKKRQEAQEQLDAYQQQKLADLKAEEAERAKKPGTNEFRTSKLETSRLITSEFDIEPVTFTPVKFDPVTFDKDGDLFDEDGNLKKVGPDDFEMTPFDPPNISQFPPTDPDDLDGYPGTGEYPSFGLDSISGSATEPDLSRWEEWLATQDIRKLEQLARAAGYPSLAFALADAENIIRRSLDSGYRAYANRGPNCAGYTGCTGSIGPWKLAYATIRLGDILAQSRGIFSTGGFSDVGISGFNLMYMLRDFGIQDGDLIDVEISQFGRQIFALRGHFLLTAGSPFNVRLRKGVAQMVITALNEGSASPNTAEVTIDNVVRGDARQTYSLKTGQTAVLRIESGVQN